MCDEWMPALKLRITSQQFHQLPRHAAYKYEYFEGHAHLTPRAKFYHALLDMDQFTPTQPPGNVTIRLMQDDDVSNLEGIFAAAFDRQQPFSSLDEPRRLEAVRASLKKVCRGGDGPWIREASFVAIEDDRHLVGGIFVTLLPDQDPTNWQSFHWQEPPPEDCLERCLGRPHITWIFVGPMHAGEGTGTALLTASVQVLKAFGYKQLATTFIAGNDSSMLWHWRNGFQLQGYPGSRRRLERMFLRPGQAAGE
ncbi:MAG TPA: GNAT family N-acetyltransferase [Gemmataceae bacterium]|nr:GNAT family N-acetyltransferase [Gemmataceae bacterium]